MSDPAPDSSLDAVMNEDGSLVVSPDQAARFHLKPGDHLRLVASVPSWTDIFTRIAEDQRRAGVPSISDEEAAEWARNLVDDVRRDQRSRDGVSQ